jgi:hypothetical protein
LNADALALEGTPPLLLWLLPDVVVDVELLSEDGEEPPREGVSD